MNKKILAVSVAAALSVGASVANAQAVGETGVALVVPYYSVQNGNATLINIVNTDTTRGKAVKVRFRGAEHSDDVFDFQVFLSPGDVWAANVSQGADGRAALSTTDNSCTLPANVNQPFPVSRLSGTDAEKAASTREGYVEIINMGDVVTSAATDGQGKVQQELYTATKHVNGVAPCTASVLQSIVNPTVQNANSITGLEAGTTGRLNTVATGGLFANVTVINVLESAAWTFDATSVELASSVPSRYWSQTASAFGSNVAADRLIELQAITLDGIFLSDAVRPAQYDFPDLSTPRAGADPLTQYGLVNAKIGLRQTLSNEFITADSIFAATDWVVSFPTRRYAIEGRTSGNWLPPFSTVYDASNNSVRVNGFEIFDREETTTSTDVVISPGDVGELYLIGEVGVVSFNNGADASTSAALGAELTVNNAEFKLPFVDGWARVTFAAPLPAIANAFVKANNGGTGSTQNYFGGVWKHR